jgi:hypothetical protein
VKKKFTEDFSTFGRGCDSQGRARPPQKVALYRGNKESKLKKKGSALLTHVSFFQTNPQKKTPSKIEKKRTGVPFYPLGEGFEKVPE